MQDRPIKEWHLIATLTKLDTNQNDDPRRGAQPLSMKLQGGLDMTLDQDCNVAIWSAFIHGREVVGYRTEQNRS
jgi:hypothetical protein